MPVKASLGGLKRAVGQAMAGSFAVQLAGMALTFLVGVQLARGLGVERYGQYGIAMAVVSLAGIPAEFGLPRLVTREVASAQAKDDRPRLFAILRWSDRQCYLMSAAVVAVLALGTLAGFAKISAAVAAAILLGLPVIPLAALGKLRGAALQGLHHVVLGQIPPMVLRPLLFAVLLFTLFSLNRGASAAEAMALNGITAAAALALGAYWLRSRLPPKPPGEAALREKRWLGSSVVLGITAAMSVFQTQLTVLILAFFASDSQVALLRLALSTVVVVAVPVTVTGIVTSPFLASLHSANDHARLQKLATVAVRAQFAGVLLLSLPLLIAAEPIIGLVFGREYVFAADALRILCVGQIFNAAFGVNASLLNMTRHERWLARALGTGLSANIVLAASLSPTLGSIGAALAYTASLVVWNAIAWFGARRELGINTLLH